jgi:flagellar protein FlaF
MQAALRMKAGQTSGDVEQLLAAVRLNWRLWTILQSELLDPECPVPLELRTNVLSLARFVDKQTVEILNKPDPAKLDILISIDRELAGGLFESGSPAEASQPVPSGAKSQPLRVST